jgi:ubiquinone/menaquinone biosynthesis C-methylase UbiE
MNNFDIREQFNKQAKNFSNWTVTLNIEYLKAYFDFCQIKTEDALLDVACGTGEYSIYLAHKIKKVSGIDISDKAIDIAKTYTKKFKLANAEFLCYDVENLPYEDNSFSVVNCKSAFHHFLKPETVFKEMLRCSNHKVCIQDIISYEDEKVDSFFNKFEKEVDISHNQTLKQREFDRLFISHNLRIVNKMVVNVELNLNEYLRHAVQLEVNTKRINKMLAQGLKDPTISRYFFYKGDELYFKRDVYLLFGEKFC